MQIISQKLKINNESGAVLILVALLLFVFLGIGALVVDLGVLYVGKNELQKAADVAALAGARDLYLANGVAVNTDANNIAITVATANNTLGGLTVEVRPEEVERGHWSFGIGGLERGFYPNDSTAATNLTFYTTKELDANLDFINAIRVVARRDTVMLPSFFSRIYGHLGFQMQAEAVGYIGYAGSVDVDEIDFPLALCEEAVIKYTEGGEKIVDCTTGRVLSSDQTARWTNYEQPCGGAANANEVNNEMKPCGVGNSEQIFFGQGVATTHGVQASNVATIRDCWLDADLKTHLVPDKNNKKWEDYPAEPLEMKLLVVDCANATPTCAKVTGVVVVNVLWVTNPPNADRVPMEMEGPPGYVKWISTDDNYATRWSSFATYFNLRNEDGTLATSEPGDFTLYLHQDCKHHEPTGGTGGENYGVLAKIPVLVQ